MNIFSLVHSASPTHVHSSLHSSFLSLSLFFLVYALIRTEPSHIYQMQKWCNQFDVLKTSQVHNITLNLNIHLQFSIETFKSTLHVNHMNPTYYIANTIPSLFNSCMHLCKHLVDDRKNIQITLSHRPRLRHLLSFHCWLGNRNLSPMQLLAGLMCALKAAL